MSVPVYRVGRRAITAGPESKPNASESGQKLPHTQGVGLNRERMGLEGGEHLICKHKFQSFCKWNVQMQTNKTAKHNTANGSAEQQLLAVADETAPEAAAAAPAHATAQDAKPATAPMPIASQELRAVYSNIQLGQGQVNL